MGQWIGNNIAVLEMVLSALVTFGFLGSQYWSTRDARWPDDSEDGRTSAAEEGAGVN